jgi:hypothetical protein
MHPTEKPPSLIHRLEDGCQPCEDCCDGGTRGLVCGALCAGMGFVVLLMLALEGIVGRAIWG